MAKSEETTKLEQQIRKAFSKIGTFGGFEVTIGFQRDGMGKERVDYMTYDTKGIWRCFELKVSYADFKSTAKKSFVGHYNYYVFPTDGELYQKVKDQIPKHIGVYLGGENVKAARKQELAVDESILKDSFIRSLARDADKVHNSEDVNQYLDIKRSRDRYERDYLEKSRQLVQANRELFMLKRELKELTKGVKEDGV
ncbi:hypothetical protein LD13_gp129 [Bacillus phage Bobb]|uniref:Uncharacterized protein n=1 Tax=Bacillus phage Bobb TaxID=1527469 RepID=A0A076GDE2_9CAUD|nr:hypothetical protein LD13_gp129 [Bacillus phage Bobb]AII28030.1 hypothetical protein [Bacillus phage Bobb]